MTPLQQKFEQLDDLLLHHRRALDQGTRVPFDRLVYRPEVEVTGQRFREALARTLVREGIAVQTVSCRAVIFAHDERQGRLEQLFELERSGEERLNANCAARLAGAGGAAMSAVERLAGDGMIFLVDVAFFYPHLQLSPVLDACTHRIVSPLALVIFYHGQVDADNQLLLLRQRPSSYYRTRDLI